MRDLSEIMERYNQLKADGVDIADNNGSYLDLTKIVLEMRILNWVMGHDDELE